MVVDRRDRQLDRELAARITEALKTAPPQGPVADAFAPAGPE
jgi:hypothetical protein